MSRSEQVGVLSTSELLAIASAQLQANGYRVERNLTGGAYSSDRGLVAEDAYSVVSIVVFDTWRQLESEWLEAQADLVGLLSQRLIRSAPKAWDGYLVLLCAGYATDATAVGQIERDTTRVRKIVATGDKLITIGDVETALDVLMPLKLTDPNSALDDVLDTLPSLVPGVDETIVRTVVEAFRSSEPPLERLQSMERLA